MQFALARAYQQAGRRDDAQRAREEFRRLDALRKAAQQANTTEAAVRRPVPDPPQ
jgi:hypothetical protein